MKHELMELPYAQDALEPHISKETIEYHHGKHHATYVNNLNNLIAGSPFEEKTLDEIIRSADGALFNNAAQVFNHAFYWKCLSPQGGGDPKGALKDAIERQFGSLEAFRDEFTGKCVSLFGSGWVWLVSDSQNQLAILQTTNAGCPLTQNLNPVLCCDVWEHAYYIDYRNARPRYVACFWNLVNWDFAAERLVL